MPVLVLHIDDVDGRDPRFIQRKMIVGNGLARYADELCRADFLCDIPYHIDDVRCVQHRMLLEWQLQVTITDHVQQYTKTGEVICSFILNKVGIRIEVISGKEEALWTYHGAISEFMGQADYFSVVDIGGGSTEIITGNTDAVISTASIDIGSVRLTERMLKTSPPTQAAIIVAQDYILSEIPDDQAPSFRQALTIGVAGTVTTLAALHQRLPHYSASKVSGYKLSDDDIASMFTMLKDKTVEQIRAYPQITAGRADIILAGILILMGLMKKRGLQHITASDRGLRYGIIYREIGKNSHS